MLRIINDFSYDSYGMTQNWIWWKFLLNTFFVFIQIVMWFTWILNHAIEIPCLVLIFLILIFRFVFRMLFSGMLLFRRLEMVRNRSKWQKCSKRPPKPSKPASVTPKTHFRSPESHKINFKISTNQNRALGLRPNSCRLLFVPCTQSFSVSRVFFILRISHFLFFTKSMSPGKEKGSITCYHLIIKIKSSSYPPHLCFDSF